MCLCCICLSVLLCMFELQLCSLVVSVKSLCQPVFCCFSSLDLFHSVSDCVYVSVRVFICLCLCMCMCISVSVCVSLFAPLCHCLFVVSYCPCLSVSLSVSLQYLCLSDHLSAICLSICLSVFVYVYLSLALCPYVSVCILLPLSVSFCIFTPCFVYRL